MSSAPWRPDAGQAVRFQHGNTATATATGTGGALLADLELLDGQVSFDETRAPRVAAQVTCRIPDDQSTLDAVDPRTKVRLKISAGYVWPGGLVDVHPLADLALRTRDVDRPTDTFTLTGQSDECLVNDDSDVTARNITGTPLTLIQQLVNACFPTPPTYVIRVPDGPSVTIVGMDDRMTAVNDLADQLGARVYDRGDRTWVIGPSVVAASTATAVLNVGPGGLLEATTTTTTRDDFANVVLMDYRYRTDDGVEHQIIGRASQATGPYAAVLGNRRTFRQQREIYTTQAGADTAAGNVLARMVQRGRAFTLRAPATYWLRPGHTITAQLPLGPQERHIVRAVDFDLSTATMTLTTRKPE